MQLKLKKSIAFFDLETTGLSVSKDRIIEIGIIKINPDQSEERLTMRINPEMEISQESVEIHGISYEDVKDCPTFKDAGKKIKNFIGDADLGGYNSNKFDIPMLLEEFARIDLEFDMKNRKSVDVQNIFHKKEQRTLAAAYQFYCNKSIENAHSAEADIVATYEVLKAQLDKYTDLNNDIDFLAEYSQNNKNKVLDFAGRLAENKDGEPIYNFGKHKNKTIKEIMEKEPGYHSWMLNSDFPSYTKKVLRDITSKIKADENPKQSLNQKLDLLKNKFNG